VGCMFITRTADEIRDFLTSVSLTEDQFAFYAAHPDAADHNMPPASWFALRDDGFSTALETAYQRYLRS
jgi:hypothetical protein